MVCGRTQAAARRIAEQRPNTRGGGCVLHCGVIAVTASGAHSQRTVDRSRQWRHAQPLHRATTTAPSRCRLSGASATRLRRSVTHGGWRPARTRPPVCLVDGMSVRTVRETGWTRELLAVHCVWTAGCATAPSSDAPLSTSLGAEPGCWHEAALTAPTSTERRSRHQPAAAVADLPLLARLGRLHVCSPPSQPHSSPCGPRTCCVGKAWADLPSPNR